MVFVEYVVVSVVNGLLVVLMLMLLNVLNDRIQSNQSIKSNKQTKQSCQGSSVDCDPMNQRKRTGINNKIIITRTGSSVCSRYHDKIYT